MLMMAYFLACSCRSLKFTGFMMNVYESEFLHILNSYDYLAMGLMSPLDNLHRINSVILPNVFGFTVLEIHLAVINYL